jgi:hypothetical protein
MLVAILRNALAARQGAWGQAFRSSSTGGEAMTTRLLQLAVILLVATTRVPAAFSSGESIGLFFDEGCATCSATLNPGEPRGLQIRAIRGGPTGGFPLAGAHFAVAGLPFGWTAECSSNPAATFSFGNPFSDDGGSLLFPCSAGTCVLLYSCTITATTNETAYLQVVSHPNPQGCPSGPCIAYCAPSLTAVRASGGEAIINGGSCTVAVHPSTWGRVKQLYE